jgi:hypothetical protein
MTDSTGHEKSAGDNLSDEQPAKTTGKIINRYFMMRIFFSFQFMFANIMKNKDFRRL